MAADKKISELGIYTISDIDNISGSLYIPVISSTTMANYRIDLVSIIRSILSKITAITPYEDLLSEEPGLIDLNTILAITSSINSLRQEIDGLKQESTWPKHTITLTNGSDSVLYLLKTSPNGGDTSITIKSDNVTIPNFYVALGVSSVTISGTTITVNASFSALNYFSNLGLEGGHIGVVTVSGSITTSNTALTLQQLSIDLSLNDDFELTKGTIKGNSVSIPLTYTFLSGTDMLSISLQSVTLTGTVNGVAIPNLANYSVPSLSGSAASGYITLSNGS